MNIAIVGAGSIGVATAHALAQVGHEVDLCQPVAPADLRFGIGIAVPQRDRLRHRERGRVAGHPRDGFVALEQIATPARQATR